MEHKVLIKFLKREREYRGACTGHYDKAESFPCVFAVASRHEAEALAAAELHERVMNHGR